MKRRFLHLSLIAGAVAVLSSCQPAEMKTETYQLAHSFLLTEDSTQGQLEVDLQATLPVAFRNKAVLQRVLPVETPDFTALIRAKFRPYDNNLTDLVYIRPAVFTAPQTGA